MQLDLPYFLGLANYLKEGSKEKTLKIKEKIFRIQKFNEANKLDKLI